MKIINNTQSPIYVSNRIKFSNRQKRTQTIKPLTELNLLDFSFSIVIVKSKYGKCEISKVYEMYYTKCYGKLKVSIKDENFVVSLR